MIKQGTLRVKTDDTIPKDVAMRQLGKRHTENLFPAEKGLNPFIPSISINRLLELIMRDKLHYQGENSSTLIHDYSSNFYP